MQIKKTFIAVTFLTVSYLHAQKITMPSDAESLPVFRSYRLVQVSSYDTTGGNNDRINIKSGQNAVIMDMDGPGVITRIWVTIDSRDPHFLRRIVFRMYWDNEPDPSVEVPVGDFFGTGFGYRHYTSLYTGMSSGGYYCFFPMPFNKHARIEVENGTGQEIYAFYYHIDVQKHEKPFEEMACFHALWNREIRTQPDRNYTVLEAEGRGHFVGLAMSMQGYDAGLGFLEGDEMVYVDGETFPSVYGTGTEDFFTSGWYFSNGTYSAPVHGLIIKDDSLSRIAAYRFMTGDAIPFRKSIRFTIEHGHANSEVSDYASTAYWYQEEPHKPFPELPDPALRIPLRYQVPNGLVEAEALQVRDFRGSSGSVDMSVYGPEWSGMRQLEVGTQSPGDMFTLALGAGEEDSLNVDVYFTRGPEYGDVEVRYGGKTIGGWLGFSKECVPGGRIQLKGLRPAKGELPVSFRVRGKDTASAGYRVGLDGFRVEPVRRYIPEWMMIGPFPNKRDSDVLRYGLDTVFPPEKGIDYNQTCTGSEGQEIRWKLEKTPGSGYMDLSQKYSPGERVVAYAVTYIHSPKAETVSLLFGSDDGAKVFLNGEGIYRFPGVRIAVPDQERIFLKLVKGWNELLLKIENNFGGYAFYARIPGSGKDLRFDVHKKK